MSKTFLLNIPFQVLFCYKTNLSLSLSLSSLCLSAPLGVSLSESRRAHSRKAATYMPRSLTYGTWSGVCAPGTLREQISVTQAPTCPISSDIGREEPAPPLRCEAAAWPAATPQGVQIQGWCICGNCTPGLALWESDCWGPVRGDPSVGNMTGGKAQEGRAWGRGVAGSQQPGCTSVPGRGHLGSCSCTSGVTRTTLNSWRRAIELNPARPTLEPRPNHMVTPQTGGGLVCGAGGDAGTAQGGQLEWVQREEST